MLQYLGRNLLQSKISRKILKKEFLLKISSVKPTISKHITQPLSSNCSKSISHGRNSPPNSLASPQPQSPPNVNPANVLSPPNLHSTASHLHPPSPSSPQKTFSLAPTPSPPSSSPNSLQPSLPTTLNSSSTFFCCFCYRYPSQLYPAASLYCKSSCSTLST